MTEREEGERKERKREIEKQKKRKENRCLSAELKETFFSRVNAYKGGNSFSLCEIFSH